MKNIHRKLLPRRPARDSGLEQHCTLYKQTDAVMRSESSEHVDHELLLSSRPSVLILTPTLKSGVALPYYHPAVSHLAFRYISSHDLPASGTLQIEVVPLPSATTDLDSRLYRTCLALLETLHRYGWGALTNYKKRVKHDCIIPREEYQDLYLIMRERYRGLVGEWKESTDPLKHVFEVSARVKSGRDLHDFCFRKGYRYCNLSDVTLEGNVSGDTRTTFVHLRGVPTVAFMGSPTRRLS